MMEKKIQHLKENKALHIYEDKSLLNRASNKKLTLSFNEENKKQNNFLQKGAILKHLVKKIVKNRQINGLSNFRSNRENYHQKVKENTKVPTIVSNYKTGITKDKKFKSNKKTNAPKKKKYFQRKPTTVIFF